MDTRPKLFNLSQTTLLFVSFLVCMITFPAGESSAQAAAPALSPAGQAALNELQKSNQADDIWGTFYLAMAYSGTGTGPSYEPAIIPVRAFATEAAYNTLMAEAPSVKTDLQAAEALFKQNVNAGHLPSMSAYGVWLVTQSRTAEGVELLQKAAGQGDDLGLLYYGEICALGGGLGQPVADCAQWTLKAAQAGNGDAMASLALASLPKDQKTYLQWMQKAATLSNLTAMLELAGDYSRGEYVAKDLTAALKWYSLAAATGMPRAKDALKQFLTQNPSISSSNDTEVKQRFLAMQSHYNDGVNALASARDAATGSLSKSSNPDARATAKIFTNSFIADALSDFRAAFELTPETDPNRPLILAQLSQCYEIVGDWQQAVDALSAATAIKPSAGDYNNLGNDLARMNDLPGAGQAYLKAVNLDAAHAGMYWRNFGTVLVNSNQFQESVDPLQKATSADPTNAEAWYLLGFALENINATGKTTPAVQPGTIEAYQKAVALDPNGQFGQASSKALDALRAKGIAVDKTK